MPRPRQSGRHRRPEPAAAPVGAPPLVLAVPGTPDSATRSLVDEVLSIARSELPGLDARIGYVGGSDEEFPPLGAVLTRAAHERAALLSAATQAATGAADDGQAAFGDPADASAEALAAAAEVARAAQQQIAASAEGPAAVVVPLLAGPDSELMARIRQAVGDSGCATQLTDPLGPHPLLAEALHVRLSEAGLARADRARLFTVATAADGIVLATVGGPEAVQAAGITGMLLSARLAVPVLAAALDEKGAVARTAEQLLGAGAQRLALAPYLIGPEVSAEWIETAATEAGCAAAEPLGAYPAVGRLVLSAYAAALGITLPGAPSR
ncbi:hypothetical protein FHS42_005552 [Streptomyces zagrosensis]|uniref:Cobalamin biosynthesis protein CbiX n=2 Tax=Streptomyces zagrosensis TaxID=1042984 RepID=A0A7W9V0Q6_9ACTN|nr:hypothetical protein [Streptomyces zagrosensis]